MNKLFKQISASYYGQWLLYGMIGLVSVSLFPAFSLGWICVNIVAFYFINTISIVIHESGHAIAAILLGVEVTKIAIGHGETIFKLQILGISWEIKQIPFGGATYILNKSTYLYRTKSFIISLFGPLTNLTLVYLTLRFPREFMTISPPDIYFCPGIIICIRNIISLFENLVPQYCDIDEKQVPNDGLSMLKIPFLSSKNAAKEVSKAWECKGYDLGIKGNYKQAVESLSQAIYYNPDAFEAYQRRGNAYRSMQDNQQAIDNYQQAVDLLNPKIELEPLNPDHYHSRGLVYIDWMRIDGIHSPNAIADLNQAIEIDSSKKSFYSARAAVYCYSGVDAQAIKDFTKIIEIEADGDAYYNRGVTYYQFKNYQAAIEDLDAAINLDSNSMSAYYNRGNAKYELEDKLGAFEDYDRAKFLSSTGAIISEDEHGFYARGIAHIRLENQIKAIKDFQRAEALCLERGNTSLLTQIRAEIEKIGTEIVES